MKIYNHFRKIMRLIAKGIFSGGIWFRRRNDLEMGSGCRTAVEHIPYSQEVVDSDLAGYWAFLLLFPAFLHL